MTFPIEKILTVSAGDYMSNVVKLKAGQQYEMKGVHVELKKTTSTDLISIVHKFSERVPESAEVVVDYRATPSMAS